MSDLLNKVLGIEAKRRNLSNEDISNFKGFMNKVSFVESKGNPYAYQSNNPNLPGRGKYQYENDAVVEGKKGSNHALTVANRLENWEKTNEKLPIPPEDRKELSKKSPDFAKLSEATQDALFVIDKSMAGDVPFSDLAKGKIPQSEAYLKYHWRGSDKEKDKKLAQWNREMQDMQAMQARTFSNAIR
jgi:hypothetical protein